MKERKIAFVIPEKITIAGSCISVVYNPQLDISEKMGVWDGANNVITINPRVSIGVQFEAFCHELAEAIADKFVNEPKEGDAVSHEAIDGFGRGLFNFLIENAGRIIEIE